MEQPDGGKLLQDVYGHFRDSGRWPTVREIQLRYGTLANVRVLAAEVGPEYIRCEHSDDPECHLTLEGCAQSPIAAADLDLFARCVGLVGQHYATNGKAPITSAQLQSDLGIQSSDMRRVAALLYLGTGVWGNGSWPGDGSFTLHPSQDALFYRDVVTFDDYRSAQKRIDADHLRVATLASNRHMERLSRLDLPASPTAPQDAGQDGRSTGAYVDASRLAELKSIRDTKWDLARLIRLCEELNAASENEAFISISLLVRAIVDHIPPIFGCSSFTEVANNATAQSLRGNLQHLDRSLRHIANGLLHSQVRSTESLPSATQVNFRTDLDVLLSEIVRLLKRI